MIFSKKLSYFIYLLLLISLISSLRKIFFPLIGDECQYAEIAKNIITKGTYSLQGSPSTFTPTLPFLTALLYTNSNPLIGFALVKIINLIMMIVGLRYCYLFLLKSNISASISILLILLTGVNNIFTAWSAAIYPEPILFCFFWIFIYNFNDRFKNPKEVLYFLIPFSILFITRYLYGVCLILIAYSVINKFHAFYKIKDYNNILKMLIYISVCIIPLFIWFKYVYNVENEINIDESYFNRFKDKDFFYNIKSGLGLIKHDEVDKVNGIPAFISLFVPVTGLRNWIASIGLIIFFVYGYFKNWKVKEFRLLFITIFLLMSGLIFAGTGFSRYWLVLLPGYLLGFYLSLKQFKVNDYYFQIGALLFSILYVINELRLDYIILTNYSK